MSSSRLTNTQSIKFSPQTLYPFEFFNLLGLDTYNPDELASPNRCVYGRNFRLYDPGNAERRVALSKRQGHIFYSVPIGETADQQITSVTGAANQPVGLINWIGQKITAGATGNLTRIDVNVKNVASGTGPLIVALYSNNAGSPGTLLATSSITSSSITSSYQYLTARFIEAPVSTSGTVYWVVCYIQSDGLNSYDWSSSTSASTAKTSADGGNTWTSATFEMNVKTYVSTSGEVKGLHRYYRSSASPIQMFAHQTNVYTINDTTGVTTSIKSGLNSSATIYEWTTVNDKTYFVNGFDSPLVFDGSAVNTVGGTHPVASSIEVHSNSLWFLQPNTNYMVFSEPGLYETFDATAFLYVPSPKTADPIIKIVSVQGVMYCFTRNTKYLIFGTTGVEGTSAGATGLLTIKESPASKGAVSQTAICKDEESTYFMSDDFHIYSFSGTVDTRLSSERVAAYLRNLATLATVKLYVDDKKLYVSYTPTGQTANTNRLVYDLVFSEWLSDEETYTGYGIDWNSQSDTGQFVLASSVVGALYYGDTGYNDLGKPIKFDWWSKYMSFGIPAAKHRVKRYYVFLQGEDGNYTIDCQVDEDNLNSPASNPVDVNIATNVYGTAGLKYGTVANGGSGLIYGDGILEPTRITVPGEFYKTQFRFVQAGVDNKVGILGFSTYVLPKKPR